MLLLRVQSKGGVAKRKVASLDVHRRTVEGGIKEKDLVPGPRLISGDSERTTLLSMHVQAQTLTLLVMVFAAQSRPQHPSINKSFSTENKEIRPDYGCPVSYKLRDYKQSTYVEIICNTSYISPDHIYQCNTIFFDNSVFKLPKYPEAKIPMGCILERIGQVTPPSNEPN